MNVMKKQTRWKSFESKHNTPKSAPKKMSIQDSDSEHSAHDFLSMEFLLKI